MLFDGFGRPFLKMRYVVADGCNYRCIFCHFEGQGRGVGSGLAPGDYAFATAVFRRLGVGDVKITGGEPLLRGDIDAVVAAVADSGVEVSMTTNGLLLRRWAARLARAGLRRVNVSIHSLDGEKYGKVTGLPPGALSEVLRGVKAAAELGMGLKLNAVVLRGINDDLDSVKSMVRLASALGASLQYIELMPMGEGAEVFGEYYEPLETVVRHVERLGGVPVRLRRELHVRPVYRLAGVAVEFVKNYGNPEFCMGCTTMRLTSDGKLKTCLYAEPAVDLMPYIRARDAEGMSRAVERAVALREPRFRIYIRAP